MRALVVAVILLGAACSGDRKESATRDCSRPDWPGPWTACAEARWVERVVEAAGYQVVGGTGSALAAEGRGRAFYIWTTDAGAGAALPADDGARTSWAAQGFTFWVESGPGYTDTKPTVEELQGLVAASRRIRPPPSGERAVERRRAGLRRPLVFQPVVPSTLFSKRRPGGGRVFKGMKLGEVGSQDIGACCLR